ncbi:MAG TPA: hypothetical protein VIK14_00280 [Ignavibacteria bacterium]
MVFALSSGQLYRDRTTSHHLSGFSTLTATSGRENAHPSTRTLQKLMLSTDTYGTNHTTWLMVPIKRKSANRHKCRRNVI